MLTDTKAAQYLENLKAEETLLERGKTLVLDQCAHPVPEVVITLMYDHSYVGVCGS